MLKVANLTKQFKKLKAVNDISFEIESGHIVGLLGPNGAGKSTTIKSIGGLLRKTSGEITFNGDDHLSKKSRAKIAYIPEVPELYDLLTAWEHMEFIARAYSIENWEEKAKCYFERFELLDKKEKLAKELSKGMRQKVSICCGLLSEPEMLMFDEPMIGLDPKAIRETKIIFRELAEEGKSIFISTHLIDSIENLCHNVLVMKEGSIIAEGSIEDLRNEHGQDGQSLEEIFLEVTKDE